MATPSGRGAMTVGDPKQARRSGSSGSTSGGAASDVQRRLALLDGRYVTVQVSPE